MQLLVLLLVTTTATEKNKKKGSAKQAWPMHTDFIWNLVPLIFIQDQLATG